MSEATFSIDGLHDTRTPRSGISWMAVITAVLFIIFAAAAAVGILVWMKADARSQQAVQAVVADARAYRESLKKAAAPAAKKKGRKPAKSSKSTAAALAAVTGLPDENAPPATVQKENVALEGRLADYVPSGVYIVIDTANNRLYLKDGQTVVLDAKCSTGSYSKLDAPDGRKWFFHTPRGQFKVQGKIQNPIWVKPDWAFIEDNKPIPGAHHPDRYEPYVMGDYALPFGNGYFIHGTLYNRLLGQSVTHGCVRLGDDDLKKVYDTAAVGTPIFIY